MWERFSMNLPETSEDESRAALQLLAMVATAQVRIEGCLTTRFRLSDNDDLRMCADSGASGQ